MRTATLAMAVCVMAANAADKATVSEEFRQRFIAEFQRTGLNTTPGDALMLRILVEASRAQRGVEVGAATGFGAINMGLGFERTGGKLISVEIDPRYAQATRANIAKMGLEGTCRVAEGDALDVLPKLEGQFDFVFIDAAKRDYYKYLKAIEPKLKKGAVVVADNVIVSARQMQDYLEYVQGSAAYETVVIRSSMEKNDGMAVSYKLK